MRGGDPDGSALNTVNTSIMFLVLLVLSILLSLKAVLMQRDALCATAAGRDTESLPSPLPFQCISGAIAIGALGYFFSLALMAWRDACQEDSAEAVCLSRVNLWASLFVLAASVLRFLALTAAKQGSEEFSMDDELPA